MNDLLSRRRGFSARASVVFSLLASGAACTALDLEPASIDDAAETLDAIDARGDVAIDAITALRPRLDALNGLRARVELEPGHTVAFYEPAPGAILISERGPDGFEPRLEQGELDGLSITELYLHLTGEREAPAALVQAEQRSRNAPASDEGPRRMIEPQSSPMAGELGTSALGLTSADGPWFAANLCFNSGDFRGCYPNWRDGGYALATARTSFFRLAPYAGNMVQLRFQMDGTTYFIEAIFPGQSTHWWAHSDALWGEYWPRNHRWDLLNASGDGFHWAFSFKSSCNSISSCDRVP